MVREVDWQNATIEDHLRVMTDLASATFADTAGCENSQLDVTDEEGVALFLEVAEQEAPGAVGYFTAIMDINDAPEGGRLPASARRTTPSLRKLSPGECHELKAGNQPARGRPEY